VAVVEQKIDAVLLRLNRVIERARPNDLELGRAHLEATGRAGVLAHFPDDRDGGFDGQLLEARPRFRRHVVLDENRLEDSGPIAKYDERDLAGRTHVSDPASNGDDATHAVAQRLDTNV
jgi:hypothetical protein